MSPSKSIIVSRGVLLDSSSLVIVSKSLFLYSCRKWRSFNCRFKNTIVGSGLLFFERSKIVAFIAEGNCSIAPASMHTSHLILDKKPFLLFFVISHSLLSAKNIASFNQ